MVGFQQKYVGWTDLQLPQGVLQPSPRSSVPQPRVRGWEGRRGKREKLQLGWGLNWIRRNWFLPFCLEFREKTVLLRLSGWQSRCSQKGHERKLGIPSHFAAVDHCSVTKSDSWQPHGLQHTRLPCPSSSPRACSNSGPLSRWCHPMIMSFVVPFSSCLYLSSIRVFSNELAPSIRWPEYWSFSFISPSNEHSGLISFRID